MVGRPRNSPSPQRIIEVLLTKDIFKNDRTLKSKLDKEWQSAAKILQMPAHNLHREVIEVQSNRHKMLEILKNNQRMSTIAKNNLFSNQSINADESQINNTDESRIHV